MTRAVLLAFVLAACTSGDPGAEPGRFDAGSGGIHGSGGSTGSGGSRSSGGRHAPDAAVDGAVPPPDAALDGEAGEPLSDAEPTRYAFTFDLRDGTATSVVTWDAPGEAGCTRLRSRIALDGLAARGGEGTSAVQAAGEVTVCTPAPVASIDLESRQTIASAADARTGVGFTRKLDIDGNPFSYLLGWVEECDRFGPCNPDPSLLSRFTFEVHHDEANVVVCPGVLTRRPGVTRCELLGAKAPTYSTIGIAANPAWIQTPLVARAGVSVVVYDTPRGALENALDGAAVGSFLEWITKLLGPFPYGSELRLVAGPVEFSGMEHPASILLRSDLATQPSRFANLPLHATLHEIAHQWAGNRTTLASALDFGWKEGIAEYLAYVFEEAERPAAEARATRAAWHSIGLSAPFFLRPDEPPPLALSEWSLGVYGTGPMTLFVQLEHWLGRDAILQAIQRFLAEPAARDVASLREALEAVSGRDLAAYFDAWVFGTGEPAWATLAVATTAADDGVTVTVTQDAPEPFPCAVEVAVASASGEMRAVVDFGLRPSSKSASVTIPLAEGVTGVRVDPDRRVLAYPPLATARGTAPSAFRFHP